jgi:hypothetical protein
MSNTPGLYKKNICFIQICHGQKILCEYAVYRDAKPFIELTYQLLSSIKKGRYRIPIDPYPSPIKNR